MLKLMMWSTKAKSSQKLTEVNDSKSKGHFDAVAKSDAHHSLIEWPMGRVIGLETRYDKLCKCFEMEKVGVIGIYGVGGVGKTILLKKFYNEFLPTTQYDVVIWVGGVSTREGDVAKIQEMIKNELNIIDDSWKDNTQKARTLHRILRRKNFVLILDGVGVPIDLAELGIPLSNQNRSKIILTTRDEDICRYMRAGKYFRVGILSDEQAFELFKEIVGEKVISSNKHIEKLAKSMSGECKGLPLAVIVVGKTMHDVTSIPEWQQALASLKRYPSRFPHMVEDVYRLLEFSYDRLPDDTLKSCFLYCSLFPENHDIKIHELIQLWTAEGYFSKYSGGVYEAQVEGRVVITRLKRAGLLEDGETPSGVKMHDIIRDVAWWIACDHGSVMRFIVKDNALKNPSDEWEEVKKLSLWGKACGTGPRIQNIFEESRCPNLLTLFMRDIPEGDFEACELPVTIKVLDMPDNKSLGSLPLTVGRLVDLEYLNFSNSLIIKLPKQLKELKKLRYLLLNDIAHLEIPRGVLCNLSSLRAISMLNSSRAHCDDNVFLNELETLKYLHVIRISIESYSSFEKILMSPKLQQCICALDASCVFDKSSLQTFGISLGKMLHLETLMITDKINPTKEGFEAENENCLKDFFQGFEYQIPLCRLTITKWKVFDLDWLKLAPKLEYLKLDQCDLLEELITEEFWVADDVERIVFGSLTTLILKDLPSLRGICDRAVEFPCLEEVIVRGCPNLRKLPFNDNSRLNSLKSFKGNQNWVNQLEWEDEVTRNCFLEKFEADEVLVEAGGEFTEKSIELGD